MVMIVASRRAVTWSFAVPMALALVAGCGEGGGKYSGNYKRELSNEGEVKMAVSGNAIEITLPSPRWADNPTLKSKASFKGDTVVLAPDSSLSCATSEARYVFNKGDQGLQVSGVGMDTCGGRRAAMVGAWEKS
jgi:hypothetical protein